MERIALVLGATGGIGRAVARRLLDAGWTVRALVRAESAARLPARLIPFIGDALNGETVAHAAQGAQLIVHAVNPPGYRDWDRLVLPMLDNTIAAARANAARVLLPGTCVDAPRIARGFSEIFRRSASSVVCQAS